jgi:hypothetical protein
MDTSNDFVFVFDYSWLSPRPFRRRILFGFVSYLTSNNKMGELRDLREF